MRKQIPNNIHGLVWEYCQRHGLKDPFWRDGTYWAFPPGSLTPIPIPLKIPQSKGLKLPSRDQAIEAWNAISTRPHLWLALLLGIGILILLDSHSVAWLGVSIPGLAAAKIFLIVLYLWQCFCILFDCCWPAPASVLDLRMLSIMSMLLLVSILERLG